jgi:hypothetical protein
VGLFDWLGRGRSGGPFGRPAAITWHVWRDGTTLAVEPSSGKSLRLPLDGVRAVRIVPLTAWQHHTSAPRGGWQVSLQRPDGDVLVGEPLADWRAARELAQRVCDAAGLPLDELTERLFSRVGRAPPAQQQ